MKPGFRDRVKRLKVTLWTLIIPPSVWAAHFLFSYIWAAVSCAKLGEWSLFPTAFTIGTVVALAIILASGWIAYVQLRTPGDPPPHEQGTDIDRLRFLAIATLLLAALSFVGVVFTALPVIVLSDCR